MSLFYAQLTCLHMQEFKVVDQSYFEMNCFPFGNSVLNNFHCDWYHEEWKVPPRYMGNAIDYTRPRLRLPYKMDYSGTWRARWGNSESFYYVGK